MLDADDFRQWLRTAKPGERRPYFHGNLAKMRQDRAASERMLTMLGMAKEAELAHQAGMVSLVQRRLGPDTFEYLAERRRDH